MTNDLLQEKWRTQKRMAQEGCCSITSVCWKNHGDTEFTEKNFLKNASP